jgi:succinate dehydrogenase / fumarate reductase membrane anchor subunit
MAGIEAWILQRISAVYLALYFPLALVFILFFPPADHEEWRRLLADPWIYTTTFIFGLALLIHAWVGVRDIIIDYIHPILPRLILLTAVGVSLVVSGLWLATILLRNISG